MRTANGSTNADTTNSGRRGAGRRRLIGVFGVTAVLAIFIALLSAPFVPAGVPVILSAVAALVVALGGCGTQRPDWPDRPTSDGHGHLVGEGPLP